VQVFTRAGVYPCRCLPVHVFTRAGVYLSTAAHLSSGTVELTDIVSWPSFKRDGHSIRIACSTAPWSTQLATALCIALPH